MGIRPEAGMSTPETHARLEADPGPSGSTGLGAAR